MNACGEFVNGCRLARQVRKAERVEARSQRKEAKLVNKATKAAMRGNVAKASKLQMRANEMHTKAEFAHETRQGALTVMAGSSVPMVQKLGSFVAQPKQRCCGRFRAAPLKTQTVIIGGAPQSMYNGVTVVPGFMPAPGTSVTVIKTNPGTTGPVAYPTGSVPYPTGSAPYPTGPVPYPTSSVPYPIGPVSYPTGPVTYPPQEKYPIDEVPPAYMAAPGDQYITKTAPPAYTK